jgi:hypothetical protein
LGLSHGLLGMAKKKEKIGFLGRRVLKMGIKGVSFLERSREK